MRYLRHRSVGLDRLGGRPGAARGGPRGRRPRPLGRVGGAGRGRSAPRSIAASSTTSTSLRRGRGRVGRRRAPRLQPRLLAHGGGRADRPRRDQRDRRRAGGHRPAAADRLRHARPRDRPGRDRGGLRRPGCAPADRGRAGRAGLRRPRRAVDRGALRAHRARAGRPGLRRGARRRSARETGVAGYVGDGANRWPAVHRLDAARLVRLAIEGAPAGTVVHATAEEGIPTVQIAEAIGRALGIETASVAPEHFDWLGPFFAARRARPRAPARERCSAGSRGARADRGHPVLRYSPPVTRRIAPVV